MPTLTAGQGGSFLPRRLFAQSAPAPFVRSWERPGADPGSVVVALVLVRVPGAAQILDRHRVARAVHDRDALHHHRERLAPADIAEHRSGGAGPDELFVVLLGLYADPLRPVHDLVAELVVGDLDVLLVGQA